MRSAACQRTELKSGMGLPHSKTSRQRLGVRQPYAAFVAPIVAVLCSSVPCCSVFEFCSPHVGDYKLILGDVWQMVHRGACPLGRRGAEFSKNCAEDRYS